MIKKSTNNNIIIEGYPKNDISKCMILEVVKYSTPCEDKYVGSKI